MFLNLLNEDEKRSFLRLIVLTAASDGNIAEEEQKMIDQYVHECGYLEYLYSSDSRDMEDVLGTFSASTVTARKVVFVELVALVLSDNVYQDEEKAILTKTLQNFQLEHNFLEAAMDWVKRVNVLYKEGSSLLGL